jgi:hypothetical protein
MAVLLIEDGAAASPVTAVGSPDAGARWCSLVLGEAR